MAGWAVASIAFLRTLVPTAPEALTEPPSWQGQGHSSFLGFWRKRAIMRDATASMVSYDIELRPTLQHLLAARLAERHGVSLYAEPEAARRILLPAPRERRAVVLARPAAASANRAGAVRDTATHPSCHPRPTGATVTEPTWTASQTAQRSAAVLDEIERAVVGRRRSLELVLIGILAGGHVLLEDLPGLGKTLIARSFATALGLDFARIQFTPDLLPSDVVGAPLYDQRTGEMIFRPGPVFTQLLLADEINRTPPKTQAALLEAMGEGQVSMDGVTRPLPQPFVVLATDNPIEYEGTYELPEAQLDRFLMRLRLGYLATDDEVAMLQRRLDRRQEAAALRAGDLRR